MRYPYLTPLILIIGLSSISGCAMTQRENRLTLNALDRAVQDSVITESSTAKVVASPLALTAGVTAGVIDLAVVTPARASVPAAADTNSYLWKDPQGSDLRQMMLFVPKVVATPVVFLSDWACRSVFTTKF
jgi:hypothetical protein